MSDIAVAVVSYQTKALLRDCLASVVADSPAEVVVVDNASSDGSAAMVRDEFPDVVLRANIDNPGYGAAANQAIAATGAAYVLLLNADTRVESGALAALARYLDDNPGVGLAAPKLLHPDGSPQPSAYPQPTPFNTLVLNTYLLDLVRWVPGLRRRFAFAWHVPPAGPTARYDDAQTGLGDTRPGITADQRVGRASRQTDVPGDQVPDDGADQRGEDDVGVDLSDVEQAAADGFGHRGTEGKRRDEVPKGSPDDALHRRQHARRNHRGDRIGGVVKAVDVVEGEGDGDDKNRQQQDRISHF
jgi:glycosyltransferase involved in cell wall biosynthesis